MIGLGKQEQGINTCLQVEKTSKRGGKIINQDKGSLISTFKFSSLLSCQKFFLKSSLDLLKTQATYTREKLALKGELHLNAIFPPFDMALMEISRSHFKQSKNPVIIL